MKNIFSQANLEIPMTLPDIFKLIREKEQVEEMPFAEYWKLRADFIETTRKKRESLHKLDTQV